MACPTNRGILRRRPKTADAGKVVAIGERRVNPMPAIFVRVEGKSWYKSTYARAHLRNKKGYVYLVWRDGDRVRELYLGKAPRSSPTGSAGRPGAAAGAGELELELERRGETKARELPAVGAKPAARRISSRS